MEGSGILPENPWLWGRSKVPHPIRAQVEVGARRVRLGLEVIQAPHLGDVVLDDATKAPRLEGR
jgi:hypothetical protein